MTAAGANTGQAPAGSAGKLPTRTIVGFAVGSLGTGIYSSVPSVLLLFYMTQILGISPGLAGLAVFLPKIWDVITDPAMGFISDHTRSRLGRRRPYLLVGAILMSVTFVFLFSAPDLGSEWNSFLYVVIVFALSATAYTIYAVPYIAMPSEMSSDHKERTVIMSFRMAFAMGGILLGLTLAPYLVSWFGGGREGYAAMSYTVGLICAASMIVAFVATRNAPRVDRAEGTKINVWAHFEDVLKSRSFRILVAIYILQLTAMGTFSGAVPYYIFYVVGGDTAMIGTFFLILLGSAIVTMPFWTFLAHRAGKRVAFTISAVVFGVGTATLFQMTNAGLDVPLISVLVLIGFGLSGIQMLPFSMLTDVIRHAALTGGGAREGTFTGLWTSSEKLGLAVGPLIVGWGLQVAGFSETEGVPSESVLFSVRMLVGALPGIAIVLSAAMVFLYPLREKDLAALEDANLNVSPSVGK